MTEQRAVVKSRHAESRHPERRTRTGGSDRAARCAGIEAAAVLRRALAAAVIPLALLACAAPAPESPVLRVGTSGDYAPFSERTAKGGPRGFDIDVARAFATDRGYRLEWVPFRWAELARDFVAGKFDLAMSGVTVRVDRSVLGRFSVPVLASGALVLFDRTRFPVGSAVRFEDLDRDHVRIAVNRGGHLERVARARFQHARIETRAANDAVRQALVDREVDAVVTDTLEAPHWLAGQTQLGTHGPLTRDRKAYWVAAEQPELARALDDWLLDREADGTLSRLRMRWFGSDRSVVRASPVAALDAAIAERLALMPWVAESKRVAGRDVEDVARERRVLEAAAAGVMRAAERMGVDAPDGETVLAFYRAQIEAAKAIQRATLSRSPARSASARDLSEVLRPALLRIGDRMAGLIVALAAGGRPVDEAAVRALRGTLSELAVPEREAEAVVSSFVALGSAG